METALVMPMEMDYAMMLMIVWERWTSVACAMVLVLQRL